MFVFDDSYTLRGFHIDVDFRRQLHTLITKFALHLTFDHLTRSISAAGCPKDNGIRISPHVCALDTHDLRRGLRFVSIGPTTPALRVTVFKSALDDDDP